MKDKNDLIASGMLWEGHFYLFSFLLHHEYLNPLWQNGLVRRIDGMAPEIKELTQSIFRLGFHWGSHANKKGAHTYNLCGTISYSSWNDLQCWVVELMIFICRSISSNHSWNLVWIHVPYYCFSLPRIDKAFSSPSLDYPQLVHISDNMLCKEKLVSFWNFAIFLPVAFC